MFVTEPDMFSVQQQLEEETAQETKTRQRQDQQKADRREEWSASRVGVILTRHISSEFVSACNDLVNLQRGKGRHFIGKKLLAETGIQPEVIAYLTTKAILNVFGLSKTNKIRQVTVMRRIADIVHDEWRIRFFGSSENRKALLKKLFRDFDKRSYPREWRKRTIKNYFDAEQLAWEGWTMKQRMHVGFALMKRFSTETGLITIENGWVSAVDEFYDKVSQLDQAKLLSFTLYQPMVIPPRPWSDTNLFRGGYLNPDKGGRYPLVKGSYRKTMRAAVIGADLSKVIPAINALQETPWRVNRRMVEALQWAWLNVGEDRLKKLAPPEKRPLPPLPFGYGEDEAVTKEHDRKCFLIHDRNRQEQSKRIAIRMTLIMAERFSRFKAIYFPHNLDSRGRAYPVPAFLNPQGPDHVKALLEFSKGHKLDNEQAVCWLAIAGANAYGYDKAALQARVQWVEQNEDMILSIAKDFRHDLRWVDASEPFQFLRFCFDWAGYVEEGIDYVSHMVVPVDATCSGLQHYGAMLRDEVGGKSVNLIPGFARQDIYGDVANVVKEKLIKANDPRAADWLAFGIDRKITKRQVMVVPYAGKFSSCLEYTKEAVAEKLADGLVCPWDIHAPNKLEDETDNEMSHHKRQVYLAQLIWQAIDEVVVKGKEAMGWLSKVASEYSKAMNEQKKLEGMKWLTPDGFLVVHVRENEKETKILTSIDGAIQVKFYETTGKLDTRQMSSAVAPNFVHALDATHLRMTILKAKGIGIDHFGMVHDSFGVHARHMPEFLANAVKPAFVQMYEEHDVLAEFADTFKDVCDVGNRPLPGSLDIKGVLTSEFFFS